MTSLREPEGATACHRPPSQPTRPAGAKEDAECSQTQDKLTAAAIVLAMAAAKRGRLACVQFGILSPTQIRSMSVLQEESIGGVLVPPGVTKTVLHQPVFGGVNDPRMGPSRRTERCRTCGKSLSHLVKDLARVRAASPR